MRQTEIHVSGIYTNRGQGNTRRSVIGIGVEYRPQKSSTPDTTQFVLYAQDAALYEMTLSNFAKWAGKRESTLSVVQMDGYKRRYQHYLDTVRG